MDNCLLKYLCEFLPKQSVLEEILVNLRADLFQKVVRLPYLPSRLLHQCLGPILQIPNQLHQLHSCLYTSCSYSDTCLGPILQLPNQLHQLAVSIPPVVTQTHAQDPYCSFLTSYTSQLSLYLLQLLRHMPRTHIVAS